ncbi:MAG: acyltransferase family protein [Parasporobacterium sp.]|nr:acyltransferase family protein [Parasporobacterium sp.]
MREVAMSEAKDGKYITGLDVMRFFAALSVVAIHSFMEYDQVFDAYFVRILTRWAVPCFFMITGFFLKEDTKQFARFWFRILLEYVIWTILYALLCHENIWSIRHFLSALRSGIIMPFWYFPALLLCAAFVWILEKVIKKPEVVVAICAVLFVMALMGHTFTNLRIFDVWNQGMIMRFHHRVIGEVSTRDGIFWGSLYIAIGYLLKQKNASYEKKRLLLLLVIFSCLSAVETALIVYYDTGGSDITILSISVVICLFLLAKEQKIRKDTGIFLRYLSTGIYLIHYYFLDLFVHKGFRSFLLFGLTLFATLVCAILYARIKFCIFLRTKAK